MLHGNEPSSRHGPPTRACGWSSPATSQRAEINAALVGAGVAVVRLEPVRHSLEQRFLEITSRLDAELPERCSMSAIA